MKINVRFAGFTEGLPPFGRQPLFEVTVDAGLELASKHLLSHGEVSRRGLEVPEGEQRRLVDALHTWNESGLCDDHLQRLNFSLR